jgi:hypothetical protein
MIISLFAWFVKRKFLKRPESPTFSSMIIAMTLTLCALVVPVLGGLIWNAICIFKHWPYHMGGSGNEPHGFHAFVWGFATLFPVAFFARIVTTTHAFETKKHLLLWFFSKEFLFVIIFSVFGGLGATLFYDGGFRDIIESSSFSEPKQETIIILIWSFLISLISSISVIIFDFKNVTGKKIASYLVSIPITMILCFWALAFYYSAYDIGLDPKEQVRGVAAGFAIRFSILCGLILELDRQAYLDLKNLIACKFRSLFDTPINKAKD